MTVRWPLDDREAESNWRLARTMMFLKTNVKLKMKMLAGARLARMFLKMKVKLKKVVDATKIVVRFNMEWQEKAKVMVPSTRLARLRR